MVRGEEAGMEKQDLGPGVIRLVEDRDHLEMREIYRPSIEDTAASFELEVPSPEEWSHRVRTIREQFPWLVAEVAGEVGGYAYAGPHRSRKAYQWSVEVSVYVPPRHRRKNLARALYTSLFQILRLQGVRKAYGGITLPNPPSRALHEGMGFRSLAVYEQVGYKLGQWHDVEWWELDLQPDLESPSPLVLPAELEETTLWKEGVAMGTRLIR